MSPVASVSSWEDWPRPSPGGAAHPTSSAGDPVPRQSLQAQSGWWSQAAEHARPRKATFQGLGLGVHFLTCSVELITNASYFPGVWRGLREQSATAAGGGAQSPGSTESTGRGELCASRPASCRSSSGSVLSPPPALRSSRQGCRGVPRASFRC